VISLPISISPRQFNISERVSTSNTMIHADKWFLPHERHRPSHKRTDIQRSTHPRSFIRQLKEKQLPLCVAYTVDISDRDLCLLECLANQLERPFTMMLRRVPREKSLTRGRDMRMPDIRQDKRWSALLRVLYYAHPDLICTPFNPQTDHLVETRVRFSAMTAWW
jgi:hypothetical protein